MTDIAVKNCAFCTTVFWNPWFYWVCSTSCFL